MTLEHDHDETEAARLSAYAFGELEGEELAAMEAAVAADPELAARVAELRAFGGELGAALAEEPAPAAPVATPARVAETKPERGRLLRFPAWAWSAAGFAAAAGVAVMVATHETSLSLPDEPRPPKRYDEPITPPPAPVSPAPVTTPPPTDLSITMTVPVQVRSDYVFRAAEPLRDTGTVQVSFPPKDDTSSAAIGGLITAGRSQYAAGDLDKAQETFRTAEAAIPENAEARYFLRRIADDKARQGTLAREKRRAGSIEEVALSWQRPGAMAPVSITAGTPQSFVPESGDARRFGATAVSVSDEHYVGVREAGFVAVEAEPLSTFSIDVDTASYSNVRRFLQSGRLPPRDAVRVEELINYFPYRYAPPPSVARAAEAPPFAAHLAVAPAPWEPRHRLVRVALKGRELTAETRPPANLVFLVDVSGSMSPANRLPLVKSSLRQLLGQLRADDRVAVVTYAGASGLALPSTPASRGHEILDALERLEAGGSTNGGMGIHLAYDIAKANFVPGGVNRVILCTDGDFNVGVTSRDELLSIIREKARGRVFLSVLGFGMGNLKDGTLEMLANKGDGAYAYIDTEREARKVFVEQAQGTLATIAKDVKIQVEFNPARVASYRLIGYENRTLAKEDFNNDRVDAGEIGAGHTVTALYEIVPVGAGGEGAGSGRPVIDPLRYGRRPAPPAEGASAELLTVKIRYKDPEGEVSRKLEFPLVDRGAGFAAADADFRFAAAVAAWGMILRDSPHVGATTLADVSRWAEDGLGDDPGGYRAEFLELVERSRGCGR